MYNIFDVYINNIPTYVYVFTTGTVGIYNVLK